ncbi:MAG: RES family NAD+ phosphorylase [Beijerinckiaceae bacterium]
MKLVRLGPDEVFYRCLTPKWAFIPLSGAGAAADGGRFNRPGVEALYLSRAPQTALDEYRQGASIAPPATLAAYLVSLDRVADLSAGFDPTVWLPEWAEWDCNWRKINRLEKKIPPSWRLSDSLIIAGYNGLLFPSLQHAGGTNLVIFNANLGDPKCVRVHDPDGRLPVDQSSWT